MSLDWIHRSRCVKLIGVNPDAGEIVTAEVWGKRENEIVELELSGAYQSEAVSLNALQLNIDSSGA
jgi:hypothetical protein